MIRTLLLLAILVLPSVAEARPRHPLPAREPVQVVDRSGALWDGIVAETVSDFNAVMPPHGPVLLYVRDTVGCASTIPLCSGVLPPNILGITLFYPGERFGRIQVTDSTPLSRAWMENVACHELMHALTHVPDKPGINPNSCVWGILPDPGSVDIQLLYAHFGDPFPHRARPHAKRPCKGVKNLPNRKACQRNHRHHP